MKKYLALAILSLVMFASLVASLSIYAYYHDLDTQELFQTLQQAGFIQSANTKKTANLVSELNPTLQINTLPETGFPLVLASSDDLTTKEVDQLQLTYRDTDFNSISVDADMVYRNSVTELPLYKSDYYTRKYDNGKAGAIGLNKMPIFRPGDSVGVIKNRYINVNTGYGYVQPPGYYFGSGVCWATSALGALQDNANQDFKAKFGYDLFVFAAGDRAPHGNFYQTYTNNHRGYTIMQAHPGVPIQDYRFTINPQLKEVESLKDIKLKIVMIYTDNHPSASHGESIGGYILSNLQF